MDNPRYAHLRGIRTRYFREGRGEPLLLLHGGNMGDSDNVDLAENWALNWPGFTSSFETFALDRLGQGGTDLPAKDGDYTMGGAVRHVQDFIREFAPGGVHLVGHSRGGYLAARLALETPHLVRSLVVVNSGTLAPGENPKNQRERSRMNRARLLRDAPRPLLSRESLQWVSEAFSDSAGHVTEAWVEARYQAGQQSKNGLAREKMKRLFSSTFLPHLARQKAETLRWLREGRLQVETLLVWGYNDPSALISGGFSLFRLMASSGRSPRMWILNRAGHYSYRERPEEFVRVVSRFVREAGGR